MTPRSDMTRAEALLAEIKPELLRILEAAPAFGSCGLDVVFHEGDIARYVVRAEVSRKPRTGGQR